MHLQIQLMYKLWTARRCRFFILLEAFVVVTGFSHSAYFTIRENKRLIGHRIKQVDSINLKSCSQFCLIHPWCTSTNFQISTKMNGKETCEFNMHGVIDEQWSFPWSRRSHFLSDVKGKYCLHAWKDVVTFRRRNRQYSQHIHTYRPHVNGARQGQGLSH